MAAIALAEMDLFLLGVFIIFRILVSHRKASCLLNAVFGNLFCLSTYLVMMSMSDVATSGERPSILAYIFLVIYIYIFNIDMYII